MGNVPEATFEDARAKAREARAAFGYDPAMLEAGKGIDVEDGLPPDDDGVGESSNGDDAE